MKRYICPNFIICNKLDCYWARPAASLYDDLQQEADILCFRTRENYTSWIYVEFIKNISHSINYTKIQLIAVEDNENKNERDKGHL